MNSIQRIIKNTSVLLISQTISRVLAFFYIMYTARYLGAKGFGVLSFAFAFAGIFSVIADLGLNQFMVRELARNHDLAGKYVGNLAGIKLILAGATLGLMVIVVNILGYPGQTVVVVLVVGLSIVLDAFSNMFYAVYQAFEEMEFQSLGKILNGLLILAGTFIAISRGFSVVGFAAIYFFVSFIILGYNLLMVLKRFVSLKIEIDWDFWGSTLREALPFGFTLIFTTIYFWIDTVMLSLMKGSEVVGWYNAAYRLIFVLMLVPTASVAAVFPVMSRHFKSSMELLKREYELVCRYLFIIALFILVYGFFFADKIISIVFGGGFEPSVIALQVLIFVIPIIFLTYLLGNFLAAVDQQRIVTIVAGANALLNILLNLFLIRKYSYVGASIATVLTEGVGLVLMGGYISRNFLKISMVQNILKPIFIGILFGVIVFVMRQEVNWILAGVIGACIYIILLLSFQIVTKNDIRIIKQGILG